MRPISLFTTANLLTLLFVAPALPGVPVLNAGDRPDPSPLAQRVLDRLTHDRQAIQGLRWVETAVREEMSRDGSVRDHLVEVNEVSYHDGHKYERPLSVDMAQDAKGFAIMRSEESHLLDQGSGGEEHKARKRPQPEDLIRCFHMDPIGIEMINDQPMLKVDFEPVPDCLEIGGLTGRLLEGLSGTIWIDEETAAVRRVEGRLKKPISIGFGILGRVETLEVKFDRLQVAPGVWTMVSAHYRARGRKFLFNRFDVSSKRYRSAFALNDSRDARTRSSGSAGMPLDSGDPSRSPR